MLFESRSSLCCQGPGIASRVPGRLRVECRRGHGGDCRRGDRRVVLRPLGPAAHARGRGTPPDPRNPDSVRSWLAESRTAWNQQVDLRNLAWYLRPKLADGAMATLLWITLSPAGEDSAADGYRLRAFAVGDCCLFHVRGGAVTYSFPMTTSGAFNLNPRVIGSVDRKADHLLCIESREAECRPGDLLVLCTDAVALWRSARRKWGTRSSGTSIGTCPKRLGGKKSSGCGRKVRCADDDTTLVLFRRRKERGGGSGKTGSGIPDVVAPLLVATSPSQPGKEFVAQIGEVLVQVSIGAKSASNCLPDTVARHGFRIASQTIIHGDRQDVGQRAWPERVLPPWRREIRRI